MSTGRPLRTTAALLAALTAVFGVALASPASAAPAAQHDDAALAAAGWLSRQLVGGNHIETEVPGVGTFADYGLTADAVLAFDAADVAQDAAKAATAWLGEKNNLVAYAGNGVSDSYVGSLAKLALVAEAQGQQPDSFGPEHVDLISLLLARLTDSGRFSDLSSYPPPEGGTNDFSNGISQSLAITALVRAGDEVELTSAVDFLVHGQCPDGGFRLWFDKPCGSDVDTTGFAIQALLASGRNADAKKALDFLEDVQEPGGGFHGSASTPEINANSTGLAAQALRAGKRTKAADAAVSYLLGQEVGCEGPADQRGAITYDAAGFEQSSAVRATPQALVGLTGVELLTISNKGDAAAAPTMECPPATTTTAAPTTTAPTTAALATSAPPAQGIRSGAGELPATGAPVWPTAALGVLLVLAGVGALLLARHRRGADTPWAGERP